jgi:5-methylcytosine-specific restriction protein A
MIQLPTATSPTPSASEEDKTDLERLWKVAAAIRNAVYAPNPKLIEPQDEDEQTDAIEGKLLTWLHTVRERIRKLIERSKAKALKQYGLLAVQGCGFDFEARYGFLGRGFIECHYTKPIHPLSEDGEASVSMTRLSFARTATGSFTRPQRGSQWKTFML